MGRGTPLNNVCFRVCPYGARREDLCSGEFSRSGIGREPSFFLDFRLFLGPCDRSIIVLREEMVGEQGQPERNPEQPAGKLAVAACPQCGQDDSVMPAVEVVAQSWAPPPPADTKSWGWLSVARTALFLTVGWLCLYLYVVVVALTALRLVRSGLSYASELMFLYAFLGAGLCMAGGVDVWQRPFKPGWRWLSRAAVGLLTVSGALVLSYAILAGLGFDARAPRARQEVIGISFLACLGLLLLGAAGTMWLKKQHAGLRQAREQAERFRWKRHQALWGHMIYCRRCDGAFMPGASQGIIPGEVLRAPPDLSAHPPGASPASRRRGIWSRVWLGIRVGLVGLAFLGGGFQTYAHTHHGAADSGSGDGAAVIGRQAPTFVLPAATGGTVDLRSYRGKIVLVDVVDSRCPYCRQELRTMDQVSRALRRYGVRIVAVDSGETLNDLRWNVDPYDFSFPIGLDADGHVTDQYDVRWYVPVVFLVDRKGTVQAVSDGEFSTDWVTSHVLPLLPPGAGRALIPTPTPQPPTPQPAIAVPAGLVLTAQAQGVDATDPPRIRNPQSLFLGNDMFMWAATFVWRLPKGTEVTIEVDRAWGGKLQTTYHRLRLFSRTRVDVEFPGPRQGAPFGIRGAGAYTVRYLQGQTVLAEGHFTISTQG